MLPKLSLQVPAMYRKRAKNALVITIANDTRLGSSDTMIPIGAIGFVQAARNGEYLCDFPWLKETGVIPASAATAIGRHT